MSARILFGLAALVLLGCGAPEPAPAEDVADVEADDTRLPHERIDVPSVVACGACHRQVWREWSESLHARAWTNENARTATNGFSKESCRPCHSPRSVFETGFGRAPAFRDFNHEDGVHCLSCHGLADGVAAARTIAGAPCRPRRDPRLLDADHCYPCHEPTHSAFEEYWESNAYAEGVRCADCHMPERADGSGRSHGPHGGMNPEFVQRAVEVAITRAGGEVLVTLRNRTGHKFPGEIPSRALLVSVEAEGLPEQYVRLRKPNKGEARADDRLTPDEERTLRFEVPAAAAGVVAQVRFLPLPLTPPEEGFLLAESRLP